jgi:hypothetical protein
MDVMKNRLDELVRIAPHLGAALIETTRYRFVSVNADGIRERLIPL